MNLIINGRKINIVGIKGELRNPEEVEKILEERKADWSIPKIETRKGIFGRYTRGAVSAMKGAYLEGFVQ